MDKISVVVLTDKDLSSVKLEKEIKHFLEEKGFSTEERVYMLERKMVRMMFERKKHEH